MELAEVELGSDGLAAHGVQIGTQGVAQGEADGEVIDVPGRYRLDYELHTDALPDLDGARDCDLALSPLTNFMPIQREGIARGGEAKDFLMAWIVVPGLTVHRSEQRYEPIDANTVRYVGRHRSFLGELALDDDGFVVRYPGLGERV